LTVLKIIPISLNNLAFHSERLTFFDLTGEEIIPERPTTEANSIAGFVEYASKRPIDATMRKTIN
jgi:hypothetical protein